MDCLFFSFFSFFFFSVTWACVCLSAPLLSAPPPHHLQSHHQSNKYPTHVQNPRPGPRPSYPGRFQVLITHSILSLPSLQIAILGYISIWIFDFFVFIFIFFLYMRKGILGGGGGREGGVYSKKGREGRKKHVI